MSFETGHSFPADVEGMTGPPCISLYQPTHRHRPDNRQDRIRFRNLVQRIEASLKQKYTRREFDPLLAPFQALAENQLLWEHTLDGLAAFSTPEKRILYHLQRPVKEFAVVADSLHLKPLIRVFQSADRYHLLALTRNEFYLYEGNRYGFERIQLREEIPQTAEQILGEKDYERLIVHHPGIGKTGLYYGHGNIKDKIHQNAEKFFRFVDRFVLESFSRPTGLPLMLVALSEHHGLFRQISRNPLLMKEGLAADPAGLGSARLADAVWNIIQPLYLEKTRSLTELYRASKAKGLATDDLGKIAEAAVHNNIGHLLVESDRIVPGRVDSTTGQITHADLEHPEVNDLLDDLSELVFRRKGQVVVLPKERMPTTSGAAAIRRY